MTGNCDTCLHEKVCALWRANECQDASCYSDDCYTPAADVAEGRHGRWIDRMLDDFRKYECACSECGARYIGDYDQYCEPTEFNYCPNCGAKMDDETLSEKENEDAEL